MHKQISLKVKLKKLHQTNRIFEGNLHISYRACRDSIWVGGIGTWVFCSCPVLFFEDGSGASQDGIG